MFHLRSLTIHDPPTESDSLLIHLTVNSPRSIRNSRVPPTGRCLVAPQIFLATDPSLQIPSVRLERVAVLAYVLCARPSPVSTETSPPPNLRWVFFFRVLEYLRIRKLVVGYPFRCSALLTIVNPPQENRDDSAHVCNREVSRDPVIIIFPDFCKQFPPPFLRFF